MIDLEDLDDVHEHPWSDVEGLRIEVRNVDDRGIDAEGKIGTIVGRHIGTKVKYIDHELIPDPVRPTVTIKNGDLVTDLPTQQWELVQVLDRGESDGE